MTVLVILCLVFVLGIGALVLFSFHRRAVAGQIEGYRISFDHRLGDQPDATLRSVAVILERDAGADDDPAEDWTCKVQFHLKHRRPTAPDLALHAVDCSTIAALLARETSVIMARWPLVRISMERLIDKVGEESARRIIEQTILKLRFTHDQFNFIYDHDKDHVLGIIPLGTIIVALEEV